MPKARWMGKVKSPNRPKGDAPVTFIESNLKDLKGRPITDRLIKDDWGGNSSWMDKVVQDVAKRPDMSTEDISSDQKKGFTPAGTTTGRNPSKIIVQKKKETKAQKHAYGPGQLFRGGGR